MANIVYRLPGREQYSYVEVTLQPEDLEGPGALSADDRIALLETALADLNQVYPESAPATGAAAPSAAPVAAPAAFSNGAATTCVHGQRNRVARGNWVAWFCPQPKGAADQCQAAFEKR